MKFIVYLFLSSLLLLSGCKSYKKEKIEIVESSNIAFEKGQQALSQEKYEDASVYFAEVYLLDPEYENAQKAWGLEIYSLFKAQMFDQAIDACDFALKLYQGSEELEHIYYTKAIAYYLDTEGIYKDQTNTRQAKKSLNEFIKNYPNSQFIKSAQQSLEVVNDYLAAYNIINSNEINIEICLFLFFSNYIIFHIHCNLFSELVYNAF